VLVDGVVREGARALRPAGRNRTALWPKFLCNTPMQYNGQFWRFPCWTTTMQLSLPVHLRPSRVYLAFCPFFCCLAEALLPRPVRRIPPGARRECVTVSSKATVPRCPNGIGETLRQYDLAT
jgi:hypothetical protein